MAGRTVLVTGGAGYIGSHVCKQLALAGDTPVVLDSLEHGHRQLVRYGPFEHGDVRDRTRLDAVFAHHRPDAVMHFAAYTDVGESVADPGRYYANNVGGSVELLAAMVRHDVGALVFSSTCATYGLPRTLPLTEEHPQHPISPYGASKHMVERILDDFAAAHRLRSIRLRYFNAAGADPDGELGELHDPETHLIPLVLQVAAGLREAVAVYGDTYPTADGSCVRDYVHVTDLADAHVRALDHLDAGGASDAYNLGTGTGASVLEVIEAAREATGAAIPAVTHPPRPGDPPELVAAADRAATELGWRPERSGLATILADAWRWQTRQHREPATPSTPSTPGMSGTPGRG